MKGVIPCGVLITCVVLTSCNDGRDVTGPKKAWGWDKPLATMGDPPPNPPTMTCTPSTVSFNGTVSCSLTGAGPSSSPSWSFSGSGMQNSGPIGSGGWSGPMIVSGTITVSFTASDGSQQQLSADVAVDRRNWTWYSAVGGSQGAQGEIDGCFSNSPDLFGLTASA